MPTQTKIGSLLNDRPVLDEMRSIISGTDQFGVPFPKELGPRVRAIIERPTTEIRTELRTRPVSESVVALTGRPVLLVRGDSFEPPVLRTWASRLSAARSKIEMALPSVGRVELADSEGDFVGTGWVVADDVVITNSHVAETFARKTGRGFAIATTLSGQPLDVRVDFREEFQGVREPYEVTVKKILFVETNPKNPDVALLKLAPGAPLPDPIAFGADPKVKQYVAVVGYPARDPDIPVDVANRYFGNVYDVKRLSPGQVMRTTKDEPDFVFSHDCTTLGGSSGSVVVDLESGKAVGLHFAGAYRTANYAIKASRLKSALRTGAVAIRRDRVARTKRKREGRTRTPPVSAYDGRRGYAKNFLDDAKKFHVPMPGLAKHRQAVAKIIAKPRQWELRYEHFSIAQHAARRLPLFTAVNIDGHELKRLPRVGDKWNFDPRIALAAQVGEGLYEGNDYDRGHMVRRLDPVWGSTATLANDDTFHFTNCTPQLHELNTKTWSDLEDYVLDNADVFRLRVSVFTGPVFTDADPEYRGVQIPQEFWKIVAMRRTRPAELSITGYLLSQARLDQPIGEEARFVFGAFRTFQVPVATIATRTGLDLGTYVEHDPLRVAPEGRAVGRRIMRADDIVF